LREIKKLAAQQGVSIPADIRFGRPGFEKVAHQQWAAMSHSQQQRYRLQSTTAHLKLGAGGFRKSKAESMLSSVVRRQRQSISSLPLSEAAYDAEVKGRGMRSYVKSVPEVTQDLFNVLNGESSPAGSAAPGGVVIHPVCRRDGLCHSACGDRLPTHIEYQRAVLNALRRVKGPPETYPGRLAVAFSIHDRVAVSLLCSHTLAQPVFVECAVGMRCPGDLPGSVVHVLSKDGVLAFETSLMMVHRFCDMLAVATQGEVEVPSEPLLSIYKVSDDVQDWTKKILAEAQGETVRLPCPGHQAPSRSAEEKSLESMLKSVRTVQCIGKAKRFKRRRPGGDEGDSATDVEGPVRVRPKRAVRPQPVRKSDAADDLVVDHDGDCEDRPVAGEHVSMAHLRVETEACLNMNQEVPPTAAPEAASFSNAVSSTAASASNAPGPVSAVVPPRAALVYDNLSGHVTHEGVLIGIITCPGEKTYAARCRIQHKLQAGPGEVKKRCTTCVASTNKRVSDPVQHLRDWFRAGLTARDHGRPTRGARRA